VGVFIPYAYQYYRAVSDKYLAVCEALGIRDGDADTRFDRLMSEVKSLFKELDLPLTLQALGIAEADLDARMDTLVQYTREDIDTLFSPRPMTAAECERIFRYAHAGRDIDF
jgi:alcohol dehydrogenase class IV